MSQSEQYYLDQLNPRVREIIDETETKLAVEDLEALSNVSVRALTALFEDISNGINKEKALHEMRIRAVEQLREKKLVRQERQDHWESKSIWLKKQKEDLKAERQFAKQDMRAELKTHAKQLEKLMKEMINIKNKRVLEAIEMERAQLERCFDCADMMLEEVDDCDDKLNQLKDEEERLRDSEERREVERLQKFVNKAEASYLESISNVSQLQFELEQAKEALRDCRLRRETIMEQEPLDEESSDLEDDDVPPSDDEDLPPPDDDELGPPPSDEDDELVAPPDDDSDEEFPIPDDDFTSDVNQSVGLDSMAAIMEAMQLDDDSDDEMLPPPEDDELDPTSDEMTPIETIGEAPKVESDIEHEESGLEVEFVDEFENEPLPESPSDKKGKRTVPQQRLNVDSLPSTDWLKSKFDLIKTDPRKKFLSKKIRTWELDLFASIFHNMTRKGKIMKSMQPRQLILMEKNLNDPKRVRMQFFEASHAYDLQFTSNANRERFFEVASTLRPTQYVWCSNLCIPGESKTKSELFGSYTYTDKGATKTVEGACKINAASQPYETIQVYCSTWNMGGRKEPSDPAELRSCIIPDKYDIYAICFQESSLTKEKDKFFTYTQSVLGTEYIALACCTFEKTQLAIYARKRHGMKIGNVEADVKACSHPGKGSVAISLSFNGTYMCFIGSQFPEDSKSESLIGTRNKMYTQTSSGIRLGNKALDIASQCQYTFWMGDFGYCVDMPFDLALNQAQSGQYKDLLVHDQLNKELEKRQIFSGYKEASISFPPTYKYQPDSDNFDQLEKIAPSYPDRILYRAWPGCAIAPTSYKSPNITLSDHRPVYSTFKVNTMRPFASIFTEASNSCEIKFDEVRLNGYSKKIGKPVLSFHCNWIESPVTVTKVFRKSEQPIWNANVIPPIVPSTPHREYLQTQHLVICVRDKSAKGNDASNIIASGILHLKQLILSSPKAISFNISAFAHGMEVGTLEGYVKLIYEDNL